MSDPPAGSRLRVLGTSAAWPEPGRACSGYLLEHEGLRVLVDLGYGALPGLLDALGSVVGDGLDAVVATHAHPDHVLDLHGLFRARSFGRPDAPRIPLFCPDGVVELLRALQPGDGVEIDEVFDRRPLPGAGQVGPIRVEGIGVEHGLPAVGVRLTADGLTVACTGDTGPCAALTRVARNADLLVAEATDRHQQQPDEPRETGTHLTGAQAGRLAADAGARRLLLTHFWPGNDRDATAADARAAYGGEVLVADEGLSVSLP